MPLEPINQLALALHQYRGMFALLIGSGVSRSAGIPTGWEIILDLIRQIAAASGEQTPDDAAAWYEATFDEAPEYSRVIERVARTPEQRVHLLRQYFEPSEDDTENGLKQPTTSHHAIASLVAAGVVKVVITTNFDRLLERALEAAGVAPAIVTGEDQIRGMLPLQHLPCVVFKIHGDYLDTRILNVTDELEEYSPYTTQLIDRIISEYGLIACGWSGDWDTALRNSILRNTHQRLPTYWMARGELGERAAALINHCRGAVVPIASADTAWVELRDRVEAIEASNAPHPQSDAIALALAKKYLSKPQPRIEIHELVSAELEKLLAWLTRMNFERNSPLNSEEYIARELQYREHTITLARLCAACAYWGGSREFDIICRAIVAVGKLPLPLRNGLHGWIQLQLLPASLLFYSAGFAALARQELIVLKKLFHDVRLAEEEGYHSPTYELHAGHVIYDTFCSWLLGLNPNERRKSGASDWFAEIIPEIVRPVLGVGYDYSALQDRFEIYLTFVERMRGGVTLPARFMWRGGGLDAPRSEVSQFLTTIRESENAHPLFESGVLVGGFERFQAVKEDVCQICRQVHYR